MKVSKVIFLVLLTLSLTACGAKQSQTVGQGLFKVPKDAVKHLSCRKTYKHNNSNIKITEEMGSEGSIETPCSGTKSYKLNTEIPNLNVVNVKVEKYFLCKDSKGKATHGWVYQHNLAKGESTFTLSTANKGEYLNCSGSFGSPLPRTVVSNKDIEQLINSRDDNKIKNCEQSSKADRKATESCSYEWTYGSNVIFTDDRGKHHAATRKKTWNSASGN
jgi:hypothetical protein